MTRNLLGIALAGILAVGMAGSTGAATLDFTGTLSLQLATLPPFVVPGTGTAQVTDDGGLHLLAFTLPGSTFGPISMSLPLTSSASLQSVRLTVAANLTGSFSGISGGPPGGGFMGLQGVAKICIPFAPNCAAAVVVPLTPTAGGAGFGIGGTRTATGAVNFTLQDAPWTIGQPVMTIHTPNSTITTPVLPDGFAHGPASLTSSTAQTSGVLQTVTATKVFTSLVGAFPEFPVFSILKLHFFTTAPPVTEINIDIKPGSDPNSISPESKGVIPVAILTTDVFDALTVDADSVMFGPDEAEKIHKQAHVEDVDGDGDLDLLLHFRTQDSGIAPGDTEACIVGQTYDGVPIMGCDSVRTVPPE